MNKPGLQFDSLVSELPFVGKVYQKKLENLQIYTIKDLLLHIPRRYLDYSKLAKINSLRINEIVTIQGVVNSVKNQLTKKGRRMQIAGIEDETGKILALWFSQPYLISVLFPGRKISLSGKVSWFANKPALISPEFEILKDTNDTTHTGKVSGIYPETSGVSSKWLRSKIKIALNKADLSNIEFLSPKILKKYNLIPYKKAIEKVHFPKDINDYEIAKRRLAFNELLELQLKALKNKKLLKQHKSNKISGTIHKIDKFIKSLPFKLTNSQKQAISEIQEDLAKESPMNRLLLGDVGSGKTIVAATAIYMSYLAGYKSILMAPTQILALQHYKTLTGYLKKFNINLELITASTKKIKDAHVYIGTHALINRKNKFENIGLVVIDEQHKFGVDQREKLLSFDITPHMLNMTATPIPRTVAVTLYGDQDISMLSEIPGNRKKVITWLLPEKKRRGAYKWIDEQLSNTNSQVFWICPLIEESDKETMKDIKSVKKEFSVLESIFKNKSLGLLHGKLKQEEKDKILEKFQKKDIDILVSTPVVEVGIDIPNATIMVIETAERFGLAQLHQLRGRVGRGDKKSYCLLFSKTKNKRLVSMIKTHSGFELAELDLKLRGPGEIFGTIQSGFKELKIASWTDTDLIKKTREAAEIIFAN